MATDLTGLRWMGKDAPLHGNESQKSWVKPVAMSASGFPTSLVERGRPLGDHLGPEKTILSLS